MNTYHVITPLARLQNLEALILNLSSQRRPQFEIIWHPIFDEGLPFNIRFDDCANWHWIARGYCPRVKPFWRFWAGAMNRLIDLDQINGDHRYCILNDDDVYEPGFFEHIDKVAPGEAMVVSMKRGDHIPAGVEGERAHGTNTLEAKPESMVVGHVGAEQLICTGEIWRAFRFNDSIAADGERICQIVKEHPPTYVPDAFVWFNYLEPGRWNK